MTTSIAEQELSTVPPSPGGASDDAASQEDLVVEETAPQETAPTATLERIPTETTTEKQDDPAAETAPPAVNDSGTQSPTDPLAGSNTRSIVREKIAEHILSAQEAYKGKDYARVVRLLEKVPDAQLTADMRTIRHHCQELRQGLGQCDIASTHFEKREYEQAIRALEQVPDHVCQILKEDLRDERCEKILTAARRELKIQPAMQAAEKFLEEFEFSEIIRVLEEVPKTDRTDRLIALLQKAHTNERRLKELRTEIAPKLSEAKDQQSTELCTTVIPLLEQLLQVKPNDEEAAAQLEDLRQFEGQLKERDNRFQEGLSHYENRDYQEAVDVLSTVHEDLKRGEIADLLQKAEETLQEVKQLTSSVNDSLRQTAFTGLSENLTRLDELLKDAVGTITQGLSHEVFEYSLGELARQSGEQADLIAPLDTLVGSLSTDRIASLKSPGGISLLEHYPEAGQILPAKLVEILNELGNEPELVASRLETLRHAERLLGNDAPRLQAWENFLRLWGEFQSLADQRFAWKDLVIENPRVAQLESVAKELAESAAGAFGSESDRPAILEKFTSTRAKTAKLIERRVLRRIRNFMDSATWPSRAVTLVTQSMLLRTAAAIVLGGILGLGLCMLWFLLVRIGGLTGIGALAFLAGIWSLFCWMVNKLLETENAASKKGEGAEETQEEMTGDLFNTLLSKLPPVVSNQVEKITALWKRRKAETEEQTTEPGVETTATHEPTPPPAAAPPLTAQKSVPELNPSEEDAIFAQFANEPAPPVGDPGTLAEILGETETSQSDQVPEQEVPESPSAGETSAPSPGNG